MYEVFYNSYVIEIKKLAEEKKQVSRLKGAISDAALYGTLGAAIGASGGGLKGAALGGAGGAALGGTVGALSPRKSAAQGYRNFKSWRARKKVK